MEQDQNTPLFNLNIDQLSKAHLAEAARWGKFLAIIGFIVCILITLGGIFFATIVNKLSDRYEGLGMYQDLETSKSVGAAAAIMYVVVALIYFFPCLFLFRFATKMKTALASNDQDTLNGSFQNLKATLRYVGIITLIGVIIFGISLIITLTANA